VTSTCLDTDGHAVTWSTGHNVGAIPNEVVLTPSTGIVIPAGTLAGHCDLQFDVKTMSQACSEAPPPSGNTCTIVQFAGYISAEHDATCDNGISSGSKQSGTIRIFNAPAGTSCDDN